MPGILVRLFPCYHHRASYDYKALSYCSTKVLSILCTPNPSIEHKQITIRSKSVVLSVDDAESQHHLSVPVTEGKDEGFACIIS